MKTFVVRVRESRIFNIRVEAESENDALDRVEGNDDIAMHSDSDKFEKVEIMDVTEQ